VEEADGTCRHTLQCALPKAPDRSTRYRVPLNSPNVTNTHTLHPPKQALTGAALAGLRPAAGDAVRPSPPPAPAAVEDGGLCCLSPCCGVAVREGGTAAAPAFADTGRMPVPLPVRRPLCCCGSPLCLRPGTPLLTLPWLPRRPLDTAAAPALALAAAFSAATAESRAPLTRFVTGPSVLCWRAATAAAAAPGAGPPRRSESGCSTRGSSSCSAAASACDARRGTRQRYEEQGRPRCR
jgi:hypothetical protein